MPRRKKRLQTKLTLHDLPMPEFLNLDKKLRHKEKDRPKSKHADAFDAFARWSALPTELREPKTKKEFAKIWKLPAGTNYIYAAGWESDEDFQALKYKYFWDWMFSILPDIAYASFQRAMAKTRGSAQDAKLLLDLIGKKVDANKPLNRVQPFFLVGVDSKQIEQLFTPQEYVEVAEKTIELERKRKGVSVVDEVPIELNTETA